MKVAEVVQHLEALAPLDLAEPWDNVGLLVGDPGVDVGAALFAIDLSTAVVDEAERAGAGLIVAYHPPIFPHARALTKGHPAFECASRGIAVFTPHTALDSAPGGTNDALARALGLSTARPVRPRSEPGRGHIGQGRIGELAAPATLDDLVRRVKAALSLERVLVAPAGGQSRGPIERVGVGAGSCGDLVTDAACLGAQAFLTGELAHHRAREAAAAGVHVIAVLHSNSERPGLAALARALAARTSLGCHVSETDRDPFQFA